MARSASGCTCSTVKKKRKLCTVCVESTELAKKKRKLQRDRDRRSTFNDSQRHSRRQHRRDRRRHDSKPTKPWSFIPLSRSTEARIYMECGQRVCCGAMEQKVCAVCDCWCSTSEVSGKNIEHCPILLQSMQRRLKPPANLPRKLLEHYDMSSVSSRLSGILLSKRGVCEAENEVVLQICGSCYSSLLKKNKYSPPKFSIANGLYIGELPKKFEDTTMTENAMLNLAQPTHFVSIMRGGRHSAIRSHAYFFRANPAPPATLLPRSVVEEGVVGVSMVGAMTPRQKAVTSKRYNARVSRVREQYEWYRENNLLYSHVQLASSFDKTPTTVISDRTDHGDEIAEDLDESRSRFNAQTLVHNVECEAEEMFEQTAVALITNYAPEDSTEQTLRFLRDGKDVVVWRSSEILSDFDPAYWTHAFCELFPFGRGGLDEPRATRIGTAEYLKHCLRLSSRCHESHPSFVLVAFDVLARHQSTRAVYLRAKLSPNVMSSAASVQRSELLSHVEYMEQRVNALNRRERLPPPPPQSKAVRDFFSSVSTGLRAHWGSNEERGDARTKVMSMQLHLGQPAIFFTFSPSSSGTYQVANLVGDVCDEVLRAARRSMEFCLEFTQAQLGSIATKHPTTCARYKTLYGWEQIDPNSVLPIWNRYFDHLLNVIIDVVLNWDQQTNKSKPGVGLFGRTEAFFASTESQNSTHDLHSHMLVWIAGMPRTVTAYYDACKSSEFRDNIAEYISSVVSASYPVSCKCCPHCKEDALKSMPLTNQAFKKQNSGALRPETAECTACKTSFGGNEITEAQLMQVSDDFSINTNNWSGDAVQHRIMMPDPFPLIAPIGKEGICKIIESAALLRFQTHHWFHSRSCFKQTSRTPKGDLCRMFFPKEPCASTKLISDDTVEVERRIGCEYLNAYSPLLARVFKCNHDIKFLSAGEGPEKAFYMLKYATKAQHAMENPLAIYTHAFDKANRKIADSQSPIDAGKRCIQSMCCALSKPQEISSPMAALYMIRGSPFYSSIKFTKLFLNAFMDYLFNDGLVDVILTECGPNTTYKPSSMVLDYVYRTDMLEATSLMEFTQNWAKENNMAGEKFTAGHGHENSHTMHHLSPPVMVTVIGKRLPDARNKTMTAENKLFLHRTMMILFKPFRNPADMQPRDTATVEELFTQWWNEEAPPKAHQFLDFSNDYYTSRELARKRTDENMERFRASVGTGDFDLESDTIVQNESASDDILHDSRDVESDDNDFITCLQPTTTNISLMERGHTSAQLSAQSNSNDYNDDIPELDKHEWQSRIDEASITLQKNTRSTTASNSSDNLTRVREILHNNNGNEPWVNPATLTVPIVLSDNASLRDVSAFFQLNKKQHKMFIRAGSRFLQSITTNDSDNVEQMIGFLGGLPGSGKSRVIEALQFLAKSWNAEDALETVAYQGVAAQQANGQTIHKLFQWGVNSSKAPKLYTPEQRERFAKLKMLIMDEVSTTDVEFIGKIDQALRNLRNKLWCSGIYQNPLPLRPDTD